MTGQKPELKLLHSGEEYFSRLEELIFSAETEIQLHTYIFLYDKAGERIYKALKAAAERGVAVYMLLDAYGSNQLPREIIKNLQHSGVHIRLFAPLFSLNTLYLGRRLHHKVVVIDCKTALVGGINIADHYLGTETASPWLDLAVELHGRETEELRDLCMKLFFKKRRLKKKAQVRKPDAEEQERVNVIMNDWLKGKNEISKAYIRSIRAAKEEVIIAGSYFMPGRKLSQALKKAAANGARIRIILAGVSDIPLLYPATRYLYNTILKQNVELYEWRSSVMHAKAAVVDRKWATIGSFNLNNLSSYAAIETNVETHSGKFAGLLSQELERVLSLSEKVDTGKMHDKGKSWIYGLAYLLIRMMMNLMTFFSYRRWFRKYKEE